MRNIWRKYNHTLISNQPPDKTIDIGGVFYKIIKTKSLLARWVTDFDCKKEMPFWYIIKDNSPLIESYSSNTRNQIKKGIKNFKIRRVNKDEICHTAYSIYKKAFISYEKNEKIISLERFQKNLTEEFEYWGVYKNDKLVGYAQNRVYDESCDYSTIKIDPQYKKEYPNYALIHMMNEFYLQRRSLKYINNGTRSIAHHTNIQDFLIKKFKFRKAYCNLHIRYHPVIKIIISLFFPLRSIFRLSKIRFLRNMHILLFQEELSRISHIFHSTTKVSDSVLILSNGNFKSGSTWVTAIIKEIVRNKKTRFPIAFQNPKYDNWINRFKISKFINSSYFSTENIWVSKTHIYQPNIMLDIIKCQENVKVINIERDIKDVIVSHFYHLKNSKKINLNFEDYFELWGKYKAIQYLKYSISWKEVDFCLKIKYEDLKASTPETIKKIADYLGVKNIDVLKVQEETELKKLRGSSAQKGLNEDEWFYRKGVVGDWKNYFDEKMLKKISLIEQNNLSFQEKVIYAIKFKFRLWIKYFLYRYFPLGYRMFDKRF